MTEWRFVHVGPEGDKAELGGLRVWQETWREAAPEQVVLPDPSQPHRTHRLRVYEIGPTGSSVRFAAGEFSNGVWGLYIPTSDWRYRVVDVIPARGPGKIILLAGATDLPTGTRVSVRFATPGGAVVETAGAKEWELPVGTPPFKHDAFLLPSLDQDIAENTLVELSQLEFGE